ncbi:MAG: (d)CMP kinase [Eubacteriales bacterium]
MQTINIAIDGPSGAGKSTIARKAAALLSYRYIDTGALYRTVGYHMWKQGIGLEDTRGFVEHLPEIQVDLEYRDGTQRVLLNGEDVSEKIRTPEISMYASAVSAVPEVRQMLLGMQQEMAKRYDVIMDGRDIGTVVLPQAQIKIFLTADVEDRARRRWEELRLKDASIRLEDVVADMIQRDKQDSSRAIAPLKPAPDAILLNTTGNTLEQSVQLVLNTIKERLNHVV